MASTPLRNSTQYSSKKLQQTNAEVTEVVDIMRVNVEKVIQRDEKLADLDGRAENLQAGARQFESSATRLKRKFWWQNLKMWILLIVILVIIIIIIIAFISITIRRQDPWPDIFDVALFLKFSLGYNFTVIIVGVWLFAPREALGSRKGYAFLSACVNLLLVLMFCQEM